MNIVILDGFAVNPGDLSWVRFERFGNLTVYAKTSNEDASAKCIDADIVFTNRVKLDDSFFEKCKKVKFVSTLGTGFDMIELEACKKRGINVCNIPAYSTASVAQLAFTLILNLVTDVNGLQKIVEDGLWTGVPDFQYQKTKFIELMDMKLGLIGCGNIGKAVARMGEAFGMEIIATSKTKTSGIYDGIKYDTFENVLAQSDIISVHCPLNDETRGLIDDNAIKLMKDGVILVNTSRGAVLNEVDVANAVKCGKIAALGVDVLTQEPPQNDHPFLSIPHTIITPHAAWTTKAARLRLLDVLEKNVESFCKTGRGINNIV